MSAKRKIAEKPLNFSKFDGRLVDRITTIPITKIQLISLVTHCVIRFTQYTTVYQDKETGYGAQQAPCIMEAGVFPGGSGWLLALAIQQYSVPNLKKEYTSTSIPTLAIRACSGAFFFFLQWKNWEGISHVIHHVADRCGGNRCADGNYFRRNGTSLVTHSVSSETSYY